MANPTTNYSFVLPTATDLVTDLPADFDVALQGVDTRLKALQPGTTLGDLAYSSATANTNTRLGVGTTGQVLTVASGIPSWATPSSGSMTSIATGSLSGASVTISSISGSYKNLILLLLNPRPTATNKGIEMRFNADSTANMHAQSGTYGYQAGIVVNQTNVQIVQGLSNSTSYDNGIVRIQFYDYANTGIYKFAETSSMTDNDAAGEVRLNNAKLGYYSLSALTSIELYIPTSSFAGGTYILYGVN